MQERALRNFTIKIKALIEGLSDKPEELSENKTVKIVILKG